MEGFYLALGVTVVLPFLQWATPTMPKAVAYAGAIGGITVMLLEFLDPSMKPPFSAVILFLVGVLCIGGAIHLFQKQVHSAKSAEIVTEVSPLDGTIQITCEPFAQFPTTLPQHKIYELQLHNQFITKGGALTSWSVAAGTTLPPRDPAIQPTMGSLFRISNYGKIAVLNMTVTFPVEFKAVIKTENGIRSGDAIKSTTITIWPPFSIGPGEIVDIYAMNYSSDATALVSIPATAEGFAVGSDKRETFKLSPPSLGGAEAGPFVPKSPPAPSPPTPSPPSKQEKK